jgi:hypothetical protein
MRSTGLGLSLLLLSFAAAADIIPDGALWAQVPFDLVTGKPMIAVQANGSRGRMLFDNGTPDKMFFNRDALALAPGKEAGRGRAASGQQILVQTTAAPKVSIGGRPISLPAQVRSGNFGFVKEAFGDDFLGFIGTPFMQPHAFVLDYGRRVLTFVRVDAAGHLPLAQPAAADVVAEVNFSLHPGGQPTTAAVVGGLPMLLDFDTGDGGTLYLRPETRRKLIAAGQIKVDGDQAVLATLSFGGGSFTELRVSLHEAGGADDFRSTGPSDLLRLGSDFLARQPSLWNFAAYRLTLLRPDSAFVQAATRAGAP